MRYIRKRRILSVVILIALILIYVVLRKCSGNTLFARHSIGESNQYSRKEIKDAMAVVEKNFRSEFKGCYLMNLRYDESYSATYFGGEERDFDTKQAIVLLSDFHVGIFGESGGLVAHDDLMDWSWILAKGKDGRWELKSWGY